MKRWLASFIGLLLSLTAACADAPHHRPVWMGGNAPVFYANPAATGVIPPGLAYSCTGVCARYYFDAAGNLQTSPNNLVRNSTMQGAVAGTPGTIPTNWGNPGTTFSSNGLTWQIVGVGNVNGNPELQVRISGTSTASGSFNFTSDSMSGSAGQSFIGQQTLRIIAGSTAGFNILGTRTRTLPSGTGGGTINLSGTISATPTVYASAPVTIPPGDTNWQWGTQFNWNNAAAIDITIGISATQFEQVTAAQTTPKPFMPTSGSAYYGPVINDHNPSTLVALGLRSEPQRANLFLGNLAPVTQTITVANATQYTISFYGTGTEVLTGACTTTMTGGAGVRTSYTCTSATTALVMTAAGLSATSYAQVEANAFATSPILTYGTAVTVPADNWSFTGAALAQFLKQTGCIVVEELSENSAITQYTLELNDGGYANRVFEYNSLATQHIVINGASQFVYSSNAGDIASAKRRLALAWGSGSMTIGYDGSTPLSGAFTWPSGITTALLGYSNLGGSPWYGWFSQIMIRPSCTAAQVQRYSTAGVNLQAENDNDWPAFANDNLPLIVKIASGGW